MTTAQVPLVCLVYEGEPEGLAREAVDVALSVALMNASGPFKRAQADYREKCPAADGPRMVVVVRADAAVRFVDPAGREEVEGLAALDPAFRAPAVARRVILALGLDPKAREAGGARTLGSPDPRACLWAGGGWLRRLRPTLDGGLLEAEAGVALWGERLTVLAGGEWSPFRTFTAAGATARFTSGGVHGAVRIGTTGHGGKGGFLRGQLGFVGGYEWRSLRVDAPASLHARGGASGAGVLGGDVALVFAVPPSVLRIALVLSGRAYVGGTDYRSDQGSILAAPKGAIGLGLRVGAVL